MDWGFLFGDAMEVQIPVRGELLAKIPLFIRVNPLKRPRLDFHRKRIYQPKDNQRELLTELSLFSEHKTRGPVIVDTFICFEANGKDPYPTSKLFGDEDNLRKAICDAMVINGVIEDDRFIVGGSNFKIFGEEDLAIISIYSISDFEDLNVF